MSTSFPCCICGGSKFDGTVIQLYFSLIIGVNASQDLYESGLSRPIFTGQNMDLACHQVKVNVLEHMNTHKRFADAPHLKQHVIVS